MIYSIGKTTKDSDKYIDKFPLRYDLSFMNKIMELSDCTLKEAKELIDRVICDENIKINSNSKKIQDYCIAELQEE